MNNLQLTFIMHHAILNATMEEGLLFKTKTFSTSMMTKKNLLNALQKKSYWQTLLYSAFFATI